MNKNKKRNLIIILARKGTKNITRQNIRLVNGKPLIYYIIKKCQEVKIADIFISTDSDEIKELSELYGIKWIDRPKLLTKNNTSIEKIVYDSLIQLKEKNLNYEKCLILNPHYPLIKISTIKKFFSELNNKKEIIFGFQNDNETKYIKIEKNRRIKSLDKNIAEQRKILSLNCNSFLSKKKFSNAKYGIELEKSEKFSPNSYHDFGILENILDRKKILVRVDGSKLIGLGHVYNMLTILNQFRNEEILILMDKKNSLGKEKFKENLFDVNLISNQIDLFTQIQKFKPDIIFNDILNTDIKYIKKLKKENIFIVNFEDLGKGRIYSDLIFNPIFSTTSKLSNEFYGSKFACVRDEFRVFCRAKIRKKIKKISITLGGVDNDDNTFKIIEIIKNNKILTDITINVILGFGFKHKEKLMKLINSMKKEKYKIKIIEKTDFISKYILDSDFVIVANGRTIFEIGSLKIPMISLSVNSREKQHNFVNEAKTGYQINMKDKSMEKELINCINNMKKIEKRRIFLDNLEKIDLKNGIERVVHIINYAYNAKKIRIKI
jgi:spore coat polysaccharide biosynthesis predicted glycosyltransferase SpsG/CMP-N-acetylneuraminic acid synthetase